MRSAAKAAVPLLLVWGFTAAPAEAVTSGAASSPVTEKVGVAITASGRGTASAVVHGASAAAASSAPAAPARVWATLGKDGRPTGSNLPSIPGFRGVKPTGGGSQAANRVARAGVSTSAIQPSAVQPLVVRPLVAPTVINSNFAGIPAAQGALRPPDVNAAVNATQIAETVNLRLTAFTKAGAQQCTTTLKALFGNTTDSLSDPRIEYDNFANRYVLVTTVVPTSATQTPALWVAGSQTSDACGAWNAFRPTFSGGSYPAGAVLDYPQMGQDRSAVIISTNQYDFAQNYLNSAVFAVPKANLFAGTGFSFSAFTDAFSTSPAQIGGIPMASTTSTYLVASVPGTGYKLYKMTNSGGPGTTVTLQATISSAFTAPTRRANQCSTTATIDPSDGRIAWSPFQFGNFVWFAHGQNVSGFPAVRYGAVNVSTNTVGVANAFHSSSSDDFNPSIGLHEVSPGAGAYIWVNWAYTDTGASPCRNTSTTVNGVLPGGGIPALTSGDLTLITGSNTTDDRFGDYSSVAIDPSAASGSCPAGRTAVVAQEYFSGGSWATRIGRLSFC